MSPPSSEYRFHGNAMMMRMQRCVLAVLTALSVWYLRCKPKHKASIRCCFIVAVCRMQLDCYSVLQEDMYSYVTVADDQQFKGKNTEVVDA